MGPKVPLRSTDFFSPRFASDIFLFHKNKGPYRAKKKVIAKVFFHGKIVDGLKTEIVLGRKNSVGKSFYYQA